MDKKDSKSKKNVIDDTEDAKIAEVAHYNGSYQTVLTIILIVLFGITLFGAITNINRYFKNKKAMDNGVESVQINNKDNSVLILNDSSVYQKVTEEMLNEDEIMITNISSIELSTKKSAREDGMIKYDVKYEILENTFLGSMYSSDDSNLKVRFAYSYDGEEWTYLENAVSTYASALNVLSSNYYDIAGIKDTVKAVTNYELTTNPGESKKIYWKAETFIKRDTNNIDKFIKANFKIEYKESL